MLVMGLFGTEYELIRVLPKVRGIGGGVKKSTPKSSFVNWLNKEIIELGGGEYTTIKDKNRVKITCSKRKDLKAKRGESRGWKVKKDGVYMVLKCKGSVVWVSEEDAKNNMKYKFSGNNVDSVLAQLVAMRDNVFGKDENDSVFNFWKREKRNVLDATGNSLTRMTKSVNKSKPRRVNVIETVVVKVI
jgi:hypothetical protein